MTMSIPDASFERQARLVRQAVPLACGVAVCDRNGDILNHADFGRDSVMFAALEHLNRQYPGWPASGVLHGNTVAAKDCALLVSGLRDVQGSFVAALVVKVRECESEATAPAVVSAIAASFEQQLQLEVELDDMTVELTERYEELNLVHHTEDQVNLFREFQDALRNLAQNCVDYLDVDMTALILQEKGVSIFCNQDSAPSEDCRFVCAKLGESLYEWLVANNETIVINSMAEPLAFELLPGVPYKVLGCPIVGSGGEVAGILATVNDYSKPDFTNSDRNLLQVMARKASKIIVANFDALTGLMNRNGFEYFLESARAGTQAGDAGWCLLHVDIDKLHIVNDTVGQAAGDAVIRGIAAVLKSRKRERDLLCRLGGDGFGILLHDCSMTNAMDFARRICKAVESAPVRFAGEHHKVTVSIGVAMMTAVSGGVAQVMGAAELACSAAKDQGSNRVEAYTADNAELVLRAEQIHLVAQIQQALAENRFELFWQPIEALDARMDCRHAEILLRMVGTDGGMLSPGVFIPAAERYHLMPAIDRWVVENLLQRLADLQPAVLQDSTFAINLSGQTLNDRDFIEFLQDAIVTSTVPPSCLSFEVTETAAIANLKVAVNFMSTLRAIGCSFALDDFGAGISSFAYLRTLPVDYLKIDGNIVRDIVTDEVSAAMVTAINQVGHTMRLRTIAEFVETDAIRDRLMEIGVDFAQGYAIGKPRPLTEWFRELQANKAAVAS